MDSEKQPASLESLPEDIIPSIVRFIKSWAQIKAVGIDRKKKMEIARRSRDSALAAMALSSTKSYEKWLPFLLEQVTLRPATLASFYHLSNRLSGLGSFVKTLRLEEDRNDDDYTSLNQLWNCLGQPSEAGLKSLLLKQHLDYCTNLQTLVLSRDMLPIPLVNKKGVPFRCLTSSLRRLFVGIATIKSDKMMMMNARNAVWILVFCPQLVQAVLSFGVDLLSFNYLQEYVDTYEGLSSVKQLSVAPRFIWNAGTKDEPSWKRYKKRKQEAQDIDKSNLETQSIYYLLKVTKNLDALEIIGEAGAMLGDKMTPTRIYMNCLKGASSSYDSIKHLRSNMVRVQDIPTVTASTFKNLKIFSLDLPLLVRVEDEETLLMEDRLLSNILTLGLFPNLQRVCVPSKLVGPSGNLRTSPAYLKLWKERRQELRENEAIKSGKVKLEILELGETIGAKGEACPSALDWISPFPV